MSFFKAVNQYCKLENETEVESIRKGILIVDDSKFSRNILSDMLTAEGYIIVGEAGDGLEAIDMAREKKPEYVFMDVEMPRLDGIGAIPKILEIDPEIKVIMCTALGQKSIILEAARVGAKDYVIKPYLKENIIGVLKLVSEKKQKDRQVIPFKPSKKSQDELNNINMNEKQIELQANIEVQKLESDNKIKDDFIAYKNSDATIMESLLEPLEYEEDFVLEEDLNSLLSSESLQNKIEDEVLESYVSEETLQQVIDDQIESDETIIYKEKLDQETEVITEFLEAALHDEISDDEALERAKFVEAVLKEETSGTKTESEAEPKEVEVSEETLVKKIEDEAKLEFAILNEETTDIKAEGEAEPEKVILNEGISNIMAESEVELDKAILNEETTDIKAEGEAELEKVILNDETSCTKTEGEAELEEVIGNEETLEIKPEDQVILERDIVSEVTTVDKTAGESEAESEKAISNEEAILDEEIFEIQTEGEINPEKAVVNEGISEITQEDKVALEDTVLSKETPYDVILSENTTQEFASDSDTYTYLWKNRFDILQKEFNEEKIVSERVSFYEYAYMETDRDNIFGNYYSNREMILGMMNAYMSLDNRLQQKDSVALELRNLTYPREIRLFTNNILEENNNEFEEVTILNAVKYNSLKPKRNSHEVTIKSGFYQAICDFVNGKSGRVLR